MRWKGRLRGRPVHCGNRLIASLAQNPFVNKTAQCLDKSIVEMRQYHFGTITLGTALDALRGSE